MRATLSALSAAALLLALAVTFWRQTPISGGQLKPFLSIRRSDSTTLRDAAVPGSVNGDYARGHFVISADGTKTFVETRGASSKPAIVFLHGFGLGAMAFNAIFEDPDWLSQVFMVRYDTRGHGRSDKPTDAAAWESRRLAQDFDAVVQSCELNRPFILAWSNGVSKLPTSLISYVSGVIYVAPVPNTAVLASVLSPAILSLPSGLLTLNDVAYFQKTYIAFINLCHPGLEWNFYLACLGDGVVQPRVVTEFLINRTQSTDGISRAGAGGLPFLAIFGGDDRIVLRQPVLDTIEGWKNLKVLDIPKAEHFVWVSQPDVFRKQILEWVEGNVSR
ncbi:putative oxidoreductase ephD [Favolaschia claudopus]|uniref:Oxidoreductase ephD n=1 Tax=Favolaschia claudopus TaxID=2862362 RepID=A0AAW0B6U9_9AGAR